MRVDVASRQLVIHDHWHPALLNRSVSNQVVSTIGREVFEDRWRDFGLLPSRVAWLGARTEIHF
jgi:hypothetical protein